MKRVADQGDGMAGIPARQFRGNQNQRSGDSSGEHSAGRRAGGMVTVPGVLRMAGGVRMAMRVYVHRAHFTGRPRRLDRGTWACTARVTRLLPAHTGPKIIGLATGPP